MTVAIITGTGNHALPGLEVERTEEVPTPYGGAEVTRGRWADGAVLHLSRHGAGHVRLSNHVTHRANVWALREAGATAVIGCTACGAVDPTLELGSLIVFDDLHFPHNRLPDGSLCTFHIEPGDPERGHWVLDGSPLAAGVRAALLAGARAAGIAVHDGGVYGHVDGPRFNTPSEIAALRRDGVAAVSQTAGPEAVLCGELGLPYGLLGFLTDYANEVRPGETTPVPELMRLMARSSVAFAAVLAAALPRLAADTARPGRHDPPARRVSDAPAVLLMARTPRPGGVRRGLGELLGERRAAALEAELVRAAAAWAHAVAPGRVFVAHHPPDGASELGALVGEATLFPQSGAGLAGRLADGVSRVFARGGGPLLVLWPELAQWRTGGGRRRAGGSARRLRPRARPAVRRRLLPHRDAPAARAAVRAARGDLAGRRHDAARLCGGGRGGTRARAAALRAGAAPAGRRAGGARRPLPARGVAPGAERSLSRGAQQPVSGGLPLPALGVHSVYCLSLYRMFPEPTVTFCTVES